MRGAEHGDVALQIVPRLSAAVVLERCRVELSREDIEAIITSAEQGNGPAQYIVANWCWELGFESEAEYWYSQPAFKEHRAKLVPHYL